MIISGFKIRRLGGWVVACYQNIYCVFTSGIRMLGIGVRATGTGCNKMNTDYLMQDQLIVIISFKS